LTGNADYHGLDAERAAVTLGTRPRANTAAPSVKRDASGNFSAGSVTLAWDLNLPTTDDVRQWHCFISAANRYCTPMAG